MSPEKRVDHFKKKQRRRAQEIESSLNSNRKTRVRPYAIKSLTAPGEAGDVRVMHPRTVLENKIKQMEQK